MAHIGLHRGGYVGMYRIRGFEGFIKGTPVFLGTYYG